jgi:hypothetical protein
VLAADEVTDCTSLRALSRLHDPDEVTDCTSLRALSRLHDQVATDAMSSLRTENVDPKTGSENRPNSGDTMRGRNCVGPQHSVKISNRRNEDQTRPT